MPPAQATLCYVVKDGRALLIHKLRGVGAGKINGPGGKVDAGEEPLAAAIRETEEEVGVTPQNLRLRGLLYFHFSATNIVQCFVYLSDGLSGEPYETEEAIPEWFDVNDLPYDRMWEDDKHWLPLLLGGKYFEASVNVVDARAQPPEFSIIINA